MTCLLHIRPALQEEMSALRRALNGFAARLEDAGSDESVPRQDVDDFVALLRSILPVATINTVEAGEATLVYPATNKRVSIRRDATAFDPDADNASRTTPVGYRTLMVWRNPLRHVIMGDHDVFQAELYFPDLTANPYARQFLVPLTPIYNHCFTLTIFNYVFGLLYLLIAIFGPYTEAAKTGASIAYWVTFPFLLYAFPLSK